MLAVVPFADTGALIATSLPSSKLSSPPLPTSTKESVSTVAGSTASSKVTSIDAGSVIACSPSAGVIAVTESGLLSMVTSTAAEAVALRRRVPLVLVGRGRRRADQRGAREEEHLRDADVVIGVRRYRHRAAD